MPKRILLIVADPGDAVTADVASKVAASASGSTVRLVTTAELSLAGWSHQIDSAGRTSTMLRLRDGTPFDSSADVAVAYLASTIPVPRFVRATGRDRDYAATEFRALLVSWLHGLGTRVVNTPSGTEPNGPSWSGGKWLVEAAAAGLRVGRVSYATSARQISGWHGPAGGQRYPACPDSTVGDTVLVCGDDVVGALPAEWHPACSELSKRSGCQVFYLRVARGPSGGVVSVTPYGSPSTREQTSALVRFLAEWSRNP